MNISMIVYNTFTHDARVMKEALTLTQAGHNVTVNCLWKNGLPEEEMRDGYHVKRIQIKARQRRRIPFAAFAEVLLRFPEAIQKQKPDVIHSHDLNALVPGYLAATFLHTCLIYDSHELETGRNRAGSNLAPWKVAAWGILERFLIRRVDAVITVSQSIAKELTRLYHFPLPAIIRNCPNRFDIPTRGHLRSAIGLRADQPVIIYQGGLREGRGLDALLQAVSMLPEVILVILGDGPIANRIKDKSSELGITQRVYQPGSVPWNVLLEYTCDADIGICLIENICLSYYLTLPNKLFEYMMAGIPVLASDFPVYRPIFQEAKIGYLTNPSDPQAIASSLQQMLASPAELTQMAHNARLAALETYNWEHESEILLQVYKSLEKNPVRTDKEVQ